MVCTDLIAIRTIASFFTPKSTLFLYTMKMLVHVVSVDRDIKCDIVRTTNK